MVTPPRRRRVGVALHDPTPAQRFTPHLRFPAVFPTAKGPLVWDGQILWHATGPDRREAVTTIHASGPVARVVVAAQTVRLYPVLGSTAAPLTLTGPSRARFIRFAGALAAQGAVTVRFDMPPEPERHVDMAGQLERLAALRRTGDIDEIEYVRAKALILGE